MMLTYEEIEVLNSEITRREQRIMELSRELRHEEASTRVIAKLRDDAVASFIASGKTK
jgi:hypothetical protein